MRGALQTPINGAQLSDAIEKRIYRSFVSIHDVGAKRTRKATRLRAFGGEYRTPASLMHYKRNAVLSNYNAHPCGQVH